MNGFGVDAELYSKEEYQRVLSPAWECIGTGRDEFCHMRYWFTPYKIERSDWPSNWLVDSSTRWVAEHYEDLTNRLIQNGLESDVVYSTCLEPRTAPFGCVLQDERCTDYIIEL